MFDLDARDQAFGSLPVLSPAGLLQFIGKGRQPKRAEGGARGFEGVGQGHHGIVILFPQGLSKRVDLGL